MKLKFLRSGAVLLVGTIGIASIQPALAADAPAAKSPAKPAATKPAAKPAVPEIPKKLSLLDLNKELKTLDDYSAMLQKAGYTTKINTGKPDKQVLVVNWQDKTGKFGVNLTQNKQGYNDELTFVAPLTSFADRPNIPAEVFFKLVQAQDATRGWYFVFNPQLKRLFLCRTIPTTKVTSRRLFAELQNLQNAALLTARVWNPAMWITKPKPAAAQ